MSGNTAETEEGYPISSVLRMRFGAPLCIPCMNLAAVIDLPPLGGGHFIAMRSIRAGLQAPASELGRSPDIFPPATPISAASAS